MASDSEEIEYQALGEFQRKQGKLNEPSGRIEEEDDSEISLHEEQEFLVHMSPDANKTQWNHVDDLDKFFTSVYDYHQRHGFHNMVLAELLQLLQFVFVVVFVTYLGWCINYPELFDEVPHNATHKKTFGDITYPLGTCISQFGFFTWLALCLCFLFFFGRAIKILFNFSNYHRTRNFFISALNIKTSELSNMTWHEVQQRVLEVQREQQICIHKQELTQLDIYHRILRFKNYWVAMVNKGILPLKSRIPFIGEHALLTNGMRFNLDILIYWSPWSIFDNSYTIRGEYKSHHNRKQLGDQLATHILILAFLNLGLSPFIFFYQIIYFFFRYAEFVKRSPSFLGSRQWSNYGRLYLRHFNELDHELNARLNRAYIPSKMYMNSFTSPVLTVVAKYVAFFAGAPAAVLFAFGILDFNDVTKVEHLFTIASVCGMVATICSSLIPDENEVYCPERLMMSILAQIHYMPDHWKGRAHTSTVRNEFAMLFQYKPVYILEELFSPLITPFWLLFCLRPQASKIVDFFRCFTVEVAGVGHLCSYAQMDVRKHGNPQWGKHKPTPDVVSKSQQAEDGKTELSLMHFTTTNPEWRPPQPSNMFIHEVKNEVQKEIPALTSIIADPISLPSLGYVNPVIPMGASMMRSPPLPPDALNAATVHAGPLPRLRGGLSNLDGPVASGSNLQSSMTTSGSFHSANYTMSMLDEGQRELLSGNMSLSVLHMHEAHHRQRHTGTRDFYRQFGSDETSPHEGTHLSSKPPQSSIGRQQEQVDGHSAFGTSATSDMLSSTSTTGSVILGQGGVPGRVGFTELHKIGSHEPSQSLSEHSHPHYGATGGNVSPIPATQPFSQDFSDPDNSDSSLAFSSLPPLGMPEFPYPLPNSSTAYSGLPAGFRDPSDHMPEIREDNTGEHEIDTSTASVPDAK